MRRVRTSNTFDDQLFELLAFGSRYYSDALIDAKRQRVFYTLNRVIAPFPGLKRPHPTLGLVVYPVTRTPFVLLYDFDDAEIRAHFVVHKVADIDAIDPGSVDWS